MTNNEKKNQNYPTSLIVFVSVLGFILIPVLLLFIVCLLPFATIGYIFYGLYGYLDEKNKRLMMIKKFNESNEKYLKYLLHLEKIKHS